jgi:hypothetical protein
MVQMTIHQVINMVAKRTASWPQLVPAMAARL